jgi:hypothetical protein
LGYEIWREFVYSKLSNKLISSVLIEIERERSENVIEQKFSKSFLSSLITLDSNQMDLYIKDFEDIFIEETKKFYLKERNLINKPMFEYLLHIENLYSEEIKRIHHYINHSTEKRVYLVFLILVERCFCGDSC